MITVQLAEGGTAACYLSGAFKPEALPLVLLHGFCEDSTIWDNLLDHLDEAIVLRIDLPGFGNSSAAVKPGLENYARVVYTVLNALEVKHCVLAGHSMGGYTALAFAKSYPEILTGLSLVHSHPFADTPERIEGRKRGVEMLRAGKKDLYVAQLFPGLFAQAFAQANPETVDALVQQGRRQPTEAIIAALQAMMDRPEHLQTLLDSTCPIQFVLGDQDAIIPLDDVLSAAVLPAVSDIRVLPGVGHLGMIEQPKETARALCDFWRFCDPASAQ
ncbi:MAG: alpha/beta fold hydrolase [Saprospiraceae bacterium]